jgi:quercetin dioxygenase-like cupin family protein
MPSAFVDWRPEDGREVVPGDVVWDVTGESLQVIRSEMAAGTAFPIHQHDQEQILVILEGELDFTVGSETQVVRPGQVIHVPPRIPHGGRVHGIRRVVTIEAFHPVRDDFRAGSDEINPHAPS